MPTYPDPVQQVCYEINGLATPKAVTPVLLAYSPLNDTSGTTAVTTSTASVSGTYTGGYTLAPAGIDGPFLTVPDVVDGCVELNGTTGYIDYAQTISAGMVFNDADSVWCGGIWFQNKSLPTAGAYKQLINVGIETATQIIDVNIQESAGTCYLNFTSKPDASATAYTKRVVIATEDEWNFVLFYLSLPQKRMGIAHYSASYPAGQEDSGVVTGTSWPAGDLTTQTKTSVKDTLGCLYSAAAASRFFDGYLAGFWMGGYDAETYLPKGAFVSAKALAYPIYEIGIGNVPYAPVVLPRTTLFSPQNLRI